MNVERLAPFFRELRAGLKSSGERAEPRIGILTPGPLSATYFEQAYLARYLGLLLVEGDDLVTRDGRVFVRTIAGLKRVDVLWRHVDAEWCDPLELNSASRIGVPGPARGDPRRRRGGREHAGRRPGRIARAARLPARPGAAAARRGSRAAEYRHLVVRPADRARARARPSSTDDDRRRLPRRRPGFDGRRASSAAELSPERREALRAAISTRGVDYVGQDIVRLSTTPRWEDGKLRRARSCCASTPPRRRTAGG